MVRSLILFFFMSGFVVVYFRGAGLFTVVCALLLFAVVPSVALWLWCLFAPAIAERQYIRRMRWSKEEAEKYRSDLQAAAMYGGARKAKRQRALKTHHINEGSR